MIVYWLYYRINMRILNKTITRQPASRPGCENKQHSFSWMLRGSAGGAGARALSDIRPSIYFYSHFTPRIDALATDKRRCRVATMSEWEVCFWFSLRWLVSIFRNVGRSFNRWEIVSIYSLLSIVLLRLNNNTLKLFCFTFIVSKH